MLACTHNREEYVRSFTALVNPLGSGDLWPEVEALIRAAGAGVTVEETASAADAMKRAQRAAERGDVVLAVGGDGIVRDVCGGVVAADGVLGIVPAGRGNDFASKLAIPATSSELVELLLNGTERRIDALDANGVIVPGNVFVGLDSEAARLANTMRRVPASIVYTLSALIAVVRWKAPTFTLTIDGVTEERRLHLCVMANSGQYGNGYRIAPDADVADGRINLVTADASLWKGRIGAILGEARTGDHLKRPELESRHCTAITLSTDRPVPLNADGDEIGELPVTVTVKPGVLRILAP